MSGRPFALSPCSASSKISRRSASTSATTPKSPIASASKRCSPKKPFCPGPTANTNLDQSNSSESAFSVVAAQHAAPCLLLTLSSDREPLTTVALRPFFSRVTGHESRVTIFQYVIAPTTFSTSAMSTMTIASHGQPSRKHPSGALLTHFLHPMHRIGSTWMRPNGKLSSSGTQNMQSSTGQYSTHAGEPAQPVQHSVMTASSFGFFLRAVVIPLERGSCFCSSGTIPAVFATSRSAAMRLGYPHSHRYFVTLRLRLRASYPAWHPSPSRLSSPSRHARAREALADVREIIFLSRGRMHEFVIQVCGYVEKFVHAAIRELQLQSPKGIRILMVSDFGDAVRGNGDPIHLLRAPFRLRRLFQRPARDTLSGRSPRLYPGVRPVLPGLLCVVRRPLRVLQQPDSNAKFPS